MKGPPGDGARALPSAPLRVVVRRGLAIESEHVISYSVVDAEGVERDQFDADRFLFLRSSAKPLIAAAIVASGAADHFGFTEQEIAIAAGSHAGTPRHVDVVRAMLNKIGVDEGALRCGPRVALDENAAKRMWDNRERPSQLHNNCSGKHAAILALVRHRGADLETYLDLDHPAEREILKTCSTLLDIPATRMVVAVDGCGIPVVGCTVRAAARAFARMSRQSLVRQDLREPLERVFSAMRAHPEMVSGDGRFDTDLMQVTSAPIIAKGGAEGVHIAVNLGSGIALCTKVNDGAARAVPPFVIETMISSGMLDGIARDRLAIHRAPVVLTYSGALTGKVTAQL